MEVLMTTPDHYYTIYTYVLIFYFVTFVEISPRFSLGITEGQKHIYSVYDIQTSWNHTLRGQTRPITTISQATYKLHNDFLLAEYVNLSPIHFYDFQAGVIVHIFYKNRYNFTKYTIIGMQKEKYRYVYRKRALVHFSISIFRYQVQKRAKMKKLLRGEKIRTNKTI